MSILRFPLAAVACFFLTACAGFHPLKKPVAKSAPPVKPVAPLGLISLVNEEALFVLIESAEAPEPGALLNARNQMGLDTAALMVSEERRPPFVIADIVKGMPRPGDLVFK